MTSAENSVAGVHAAGVHAPAGEPVTARVSSGPPLRAWQRRALTKYPVSYTHLTLPTSDLV